MSLNRSQCLWFFVVKVVLKLSKSCIKVASKLSQNISQSEAVQKLPRRGQTGFLSMLLFKSAYIVAVGKTDAGKYEIRLKLYFIVCVCNKLSLAHSG